MNYILNLSNVVLIVVVIIDYSENVICKSKYHTP